MGCCVTSAPCLNPMTSLLTSPSCSTVATIALIGSCSMATSPWGRPAGPADVVESTLPRHSLGSKASPANGRGLQPPRSRLRQEKPYPDYPLPNRRPDQTCPRRKTPAQGPRLPRSVRHPRGPPPPAGLESPEEPPGQAGPAPPRPLAAHPAVSLSPVRQRVG